MVVCCLVVVVLVVALSAFGVLGVRLQGCGGSGVALGVQPEPRTSGTGFRRRLFCYVVLNGWGGGEGQ